MMSRSRHRLFVGSARTAALGALLAGALVAAGCVGDNDDEATTVPPAPTATATQPVANTETPANGSNSTTLQGAPLDFADLVEQVTPSVVFIESLSLIGASGSGMVVDREGHILTNYHVIEGQTELKVVLSDRSASRATVVGVDPANDLAIIRAEDFPSSLLHPVTFADSDAVRVGEAVFAIGAPFRHQFSVSSGIISAVERHTVSSFTGRTIRDVLQTDTALNRGNSGGPLFNLRGEVVGVNTSIENPDGRVFIGLGFAVPSNTVVGFLPQMLAGEDIQHPQLGVGGEAVDRLIAASRGLAVDRGMFISSVSPGSAAERAGVRPGDVIQVLNGQTTESLVQLVRAIDSANVGDDVAVIVNRNGEEIALTVTLQPWDLN